MGPAHSLWGQRHFLKAAIRPLEVANLVPLRIKGQDGPRVTVKSREYDEPLTIRCLPQSGGGEKSWESLPLSPQLALGRTVTQSVGTRRLLTAEAS